MKLLKVGIERKFSRSEAERRKDTRYGTAVLVFRIGKAACCDPERYGEGDSSDALDGVRLVNDDKLVEDC
ncbi:hypothetical protein VNO80_25981 [Phaseolus coccineus]|uniref:Uncharacterized protein n=1 Tax=Phaseolus coccineus TaxID=3886 RepID=A0AAN9LV59_PHACN